MPGAPALLALGYGAYLLGSHAAGTLYYYIHPIYVVPAAVTGALLVVLALLGWRGRGAGRAGPLLFTVPLAAGLLLPAQPLGVAAVQQRGMNAAPLGAPDGGPSFTVAVDPASYTIKDWVKAFQLDPEPAAHAGKPVRVTGFVYRDARLSAETFLVARFVVQCCAVDAQPVGLVVRAPEGPSLAPGRWVEVEGVMEVAEVDGRRRAVVAATAVREAPRPDQPYLY